MKTKNTRQPSRVCQRSCFWFTMKTEIPVDKVCCRALLFRCGIRLRLRVYRWQRQRIADKLHHVVGSPVRAFYPLHIISDGGILVWFQDRIVCHYNGNGRLKVVRYIRNEFRSISIDWRSGLSANFDRLILIISSSPIESRKISESISTVISGYIKNASGTVISVRFCRKGRMAAESQPCLKLWLFLTASILRAERGITISQPKLLEHNDMKWIKADELAEYEFCPADEEIIRRLKNRYELQKAWFRKY